MVTSPKDKEGRKVVWGQQTCCLFRSLVVCPPQSTSLSGALDCDTRYVNSHVIRILRELKKKGERKRERERERERARERERERRRRGKPPLRQKVRQ